MHLFLDTASHDGLLALTDATRVVTARSINAKTRDDEIVPLVAGLLQEVGISGPSLAGIACVVGPGGFTSVRVGVALANAWAWAWKRPLAGIHLSDLYRERCAAADVIWLHSTKRSEVFVRGWGMYASLWPQATHRTLDALLAELPEHAAFVGEVLPEQAQRLATRGCSPAPLRDLAHVLPQHVRACAFAAAPLSPWYGRGW